MISHPINVTLCWHMPERSSRKNSNHHHLLSLQAPSFWASRRRGLLELSLWVPFGKLHDKWQAFYIPISSYKVTSTLTPVSPKLSFWEDCSSGNGKHVPSSRGDHVTSLWSSSYSASYGDSATRQIKSLPVLSFNSAISPSVFGWAESKLPFLLMVLCCCWYLPGKLPGTIPMFCPSRDSPATMSVEVHLLHFNPLCQGDWPTL